MVSPAPDPTKVLRDAIQDFQSCLSDQERLDLAQVKSAPDADSVLVFTASLDRMNPKKRGSSVATRLYSFLQSFQEFAGIVDTFVSSNPEVAALVWGSVKFTMSFMVNFASYFQDMSKALIHFGKWSPRFAEYRLLFPDSVRLQGALCTFYATVIGCCKTIIQISKRSWPTLLANSLLSSFQSELQPLVRAIQTAAREVTYEVELANAQANKKEQELQANERLAAAASRRKLLTFIPKANAEIDQFKDWREKSVQISAARKKQQLLDALSTFDYLDAFKKARKKRHQGTGSWLAESSSFKAWNESPIHHTLWLSGKIGAGKTVLCASTIDHLFMNRETGQPVLFFFPRFDDAASLEAETILRSLLRQCLYAETLSDSDVEALSRAKSDHWPMESLTKMLRSKLSTSSKTFLVIDAWDEIRSGERRTLLDHLSDLTSQRPGLIKVLITSRSNLDQEVMKPFFYTTQVRMNSEGLRMDLAVYCEEVVRAKLDERDLIVVDEGLVAEIIQALSKGAKGMFLWVALEIEDMCTQHCDADIRQALLRLPKSLRELFTRALERVAARNKGEICKSIFQWVVTARRPLTLAELKDALPIRVGQQYTEPGRAIAGIERLGVWCEHLIEIDEETDEVELAHPSIRQFIVDETLELKSNPVTGGFHKGFENMERLTSDLCVTYLQLNDFKTTIAIREDDRVRIPQQTKIMAGIALSGGKHKKIAGLLRRTILQDDGARSSTEQPAPYEATFNRASGSQRQLVQGHPFLAYASTYWLHHSKSIYQYEQTFRAWRSMVEGKHALALTPWTELQWQRRDQFILDWALEKEHFAVLRLAFLDSAAPYSRNTNAPAPPSPFSSPERAIGHLAKLSNLDLFNEYLRSYQSGDHARFLQSHPWTTYEVMVTALSKYYTPYKLTTSSKGFILVNAIERLWQGFAQIPTDIAAVYLLLLQIGEPPQREEAACYLFLNHPDLASNRFPEGYKTVLMAAIEAGHDWTVQVILQHSGLHVVDPQIWEHDGSRPISVDLTLNDAFHKAINATQPKVARTLLKYGADPNSLNSSGVPALYPLIMRFIRPGLRRKRSPSPTKIPKPMDGNELSDLISDLLKHGGDLRGQAGGGNTVLGLLKRLEYENPGNPLFSRLIRQIKEESRYPIPEPALFRP